MRLISSIFIFILLFYTAEGIGQIKRRPTTKIDKKENRQDQFYEKLTADIKIGNVGFFRNLYLSGKGNIGYQILPYLSAGAGIKTFYTQIFITGGPDDKYVDLGGFLYARGKIFNNFYLQGEYHYTSFDYINPSFPGIDLFYPSIGAGYASGGDKWRFGLEINFNLDELARDYQGSVIEYWAGAFYNF